MYAHYTASTIVFIRIQFLQNTEYGDRHNENNTLLKEILEYQKVKTLSFP